MLSSSKPTAAKRTSRQPPRLPGQRREHRRRASHPCEHLLPSSLPPQRAPPAIALPLASPSAARTVRPHPPSPAPTPPLEPPSTPPPAARIVQPIMVEITGSSSFSSGRVFYRKPIKVVDGSPGKMTSFSTRFTFSMSPQNGDGLAFVVVPIGFPLDVFNGGPFGLLSEKKFRTLAVEFNTFMDDEFGDVNGNHVGVDLNSVVSVKVGNASFINLVLNNGEKLQSWIDYEAGSKRLAKLGGMKPIDPLVSCPIDLSRMWKEEEVFIGLSSSNGNSSQSCNVHSWSFELRVVPHWMHSQPLDPKAFSEKMKALPLPKRRNCLSRVLAALIFGTGCGVLGLFVVMFIWTMFGNRLPVVPEEYSPKPETLEHKKLKVVVEKAIEDGRN